MNVLLDLSQDCLSGGAAAQASSVLGGRTLWTPNSRSALPQLVGREQPQPTASKDTFGI